MPEEQIQYLPPDRICTDRQARETFDEETLAGLAESLREVGQQQPLRLRRDGDRLVIVDGERRWRAAKMAGLTVLAVIIEEKELCEAEVIHRQLVSNCQRDDLTAWEKSQAIQRLMKEAGWTASQTAKKLGLSPASVTRLLAPLGLPESIRRQLEAGEISGSAAYELARVEDPAKQAELAARVASGELSRDGLSVVVKRTKKPASDKAPAKSARVVLTLGEGRTMTIAGPALTGIETLVSWLEELLTSCRKAQRSGFAVDTLQKMLKDQAGN